MENIEKKLYKPFVLDFEGNEGVGKSTIAKIIKKRLEGMGMEVCLTREPGGVEASEEMRSVILKDRGEGNQLEGITEAYLFVASRSEHISKKVLPALENGQVVIMDRYYYSSYAYQGEARGVGFEKVCEINKPVIEKCIPDLTIYLKGTNAVRASRLNKRKAESLNRLDKESEAFSDLVDQGYEKCKRFPEFVEINSDGSLEEVSERCFVLMREKGLVE